MMRAVSRPIPMRRFSHHTGVVMGAGSKDVHAALRTLLEGERTTLA